MLNSGPKNEDFSSLLSSFKFDKTRKKTKISETSMTVVANPMHSSDILASLLINQALGSKMDGFPGRLDS